MNVKRLTRLKRCCVNRVNLRMISDVPLGLFLSGGIDSSTVASLMQSMRSDPIKTFTVGSLETDFDEARYAREVARHLGTDHTELYVTEAETLATVPDIPHIYDEPFGDSSQIPTTLISRLAGQHVTVALSGDGGDELFCGYSRYLFMERLWRTIKAIPRFMRKPAAGILRAISHSLKHRRVDAVSSSLLNHRHHIVANRMAELANVIEETAFVELYRRFMSQIKDPKSFAPGSRDSNQMPTHWSCNLEPMDHFQIMSCLDLASYLPDDILVKVDRAGMSVGLEVRVPILDHRVVEFASRIPSAEKIHGRTGKMQLRSVLRRYVPDRLIDRPKQGFGIPVALWLRGPLREWAEGLLAEKRLANEGYFDVAHVRSIWDPARKRSSGLESSYLDDPHVSGLAPSKAHPPDSGDIACAGVTMRSRSSQESTTFAQGVKNDAGQEDGSSQFEGACARQCSEKIALFLPSLLGGGAERVMVQLAGALSEEGHPVDLVVASPVGPYRDEVADSVRVIDLNVRRTALALFPLAGYLRKERPEALLSSMTHANVIAILAARLARTNSRVVVQEVTLINSCMLTVPSLRGRWVMRLAGFMYPRAHAVIAVSRGAARELHENLNVPDDKLHVIFNPLVSAKLKARSQEPIEDPWFEPGASPVILGVGRLHPEKDFATLIHAFARVRRKMAAHLIILGEGSERDSLERLAKELRLTNDIVMPGFVNNPLPYMSKASVLALTSWFEGLGNVLIEALACGTPVVATDCPTGPREILENGRYGLLVPVGDAEALAEALITTISNPPPQSLLEEAAARFAVDTITQRYLDVMCR
jgi:asparagine synthetase B (glutamine-hydrolysing)/glycosyltransferase involved in cell wall biosynthesis